MMKPNSRFSFELDLYQQGYGAVIGCDEVGRGSLAGPVVAAAVVLNPAHVMTADWYGKVTDSKKVSPSMRTQLNDLLVGNVVAWGIGSVAPNRIDRINIHNASLLAMKQAVGALHMALSPDSTAFVAVDGKHEIPGLAYGQSAIVSGDNFILSISAASIMAKVYRDNVMAKLHKRFPQYGYDKHKGYATRDHRAAIKKYGLSPVHRATFCGNIL